MGGNGSRGVGIVAGDGSPSSERIRSIRRRARFGPFCTGQQQRQKFTVLPQQPPLQFQAAGQLDADRAPLADPLLQQPHPGSDVSSSWSGAIRSDQVAKAF